MNANKRSSAFWNFDEMFFVRYEKLSESLYQIGLLFEILRPAQVEIFYVIQSFMTNNFNLRVENFLRGA